MISRTCSESLEERPEVGSSKRKTSAGVIMSRPTLRRLRSPLERIFCSGRPAGLLRRSLRPSSMSLASTRREMSRRLR